MSVNVSPAISTILSSSSSSILALVPLLSTRVGRMIKLARVRRWLTFNRAPVPP